MANTCYFSGRWGNIVFNISMLVAYCKKWDIPYYIPVEARAYNHFRKGDMRLPYTVPSTAEKPVNPVMYREPHNRGVRQPYYHEIPKMDNVIFEGYYQSFKYFDWCREYVLEVFNFPYQKEGGITGVSVRRGDCVGNEGSFPLAPRTYYQNAIKFMQAAGFNKFRIYSDDIPWCKEEFVNDNYPDAEFEFSEGKNEIQDYISLMCCANQITARSTFSLTAAWFNQNPDKIVCVPTTRHKYWTSQNINLIPEYFHQIDFEDEQ